MLLKGYVGQGLCTLTGYNTNLVPAGIVSSDPDMRLSKILQSWAYDLLNPRLSRGQC